MGSGNTSSSSMWMHLFTGIPLEQCIGAGAGLNTEGIRHKFDVLSRAAANYSGDGSVKSRLAWFGGYEMAMAVGGMLRAAELGMIIIVDGFITSMKMMCCRSPSRQNLLCCILWRHVCRSRLQLLFAGRGQILLQS